YMSPEQGRGEDVDERSDIWSFCVVLYEALTGTLPFDSDNHLALIRAIIEEPVPPIAERGVVNEALWAILERGLTKKPSERWSSMRELGSALATWLADEGVFDDISGASVDAMWKRRRQSLHGDEVLSDPRRSGRRQRAELETRDESAPSSRRSSPSGDAPPESLRTSTPLPDSTGGQRAPTPVPGSRPGDHAERRSDGEIARRPPTKTPVGFVVGALGLGLGLAAFGWLYLRPSDASVAARSGSPTSADSAKVARSAPTASARDDTRAHATTSAAPSSAPVAPSATAIVAASASAPLPSSRPAASPAAKPTTARPPAASPPEAGGPQLKVPEL
ncbi:MAG TPA: protein kinase, partial [Polyangiaceae bacterium]|nr:protein kinase [Polyangiaceae bacterium]